MNRFFADGAPLRQYGMRLLRRSRWLILLVITILGGTSTLLAIPETSARIRNQIPFMRCWYPVRMDPARFSLIVSPFVTVQENGRAAIASDGRALAHFLYTQLAENLDDLELDVPVELRAPDRVCPVRGGSPDARAQSAATLARKTGANVVVYGALTQQGGAGYFHPEFYVAAPSARQQTELNAVAGPYQLGSAIPMVLPIQPQNLVGLDDQPALVRVRALSLIALGLRAAASGQSARALEYLQSAEEIPEWLESEGKEILYLFLGNTASALAYDERDNGFLDDAGIYYDQALAIKPEFARAIVGKANVLFQQSIGDFAALSCSEVDPDGLLAAGDEYRRSASTPADADAEIPLKVHYGLGNIALTQAYCFDPAAIDDARREYDAMVKMHAERPVASAELVAHAYARLALIAAEYDKQPAQALALYNKAIPLSPPRFQAEYLMLAGDLLRAQDKVADARTYYTKARDAATLAGASNLIQEAAQRLSAPP